jgi:uncharacterized protein YodC (DUF2158 family)
MSGDFAVGDVVRLKSGGPPMTVRNPSNWTDDVVVDWFDGADMGTEWLKAAQLCHVRSPDFTAELDEAIMADLARREIEPVSDFDPAILDEARRTAKRRSAALSRLAELDATEIADMPCFKLGDRVRFTDKLDLGWWFKPGQVGTITAVRVAGRPPYRYDVDVDNLGGDKCPALVNDEHIEHAESLADSILREAGLTKNGFTWAGAVEQMKAGEWMRRRAWRDKGIVITFAAGRTPLDGGFAPTITVRDELGWHLSAPPLSAADFEADDWEIAS